MKAADAGGAEGAHRLGRRRRLLVLSAGSFLVVTAGVVSPSGISAVPAAPWTELVSTGDLGAQGNADSAQPDISSDGRYVVFDSRADNMIFGDMNHFDDVFVRDRQAATPTRASVSSADVEGAAGSLDSSISADGRYVTFYSDAPNLVADDTNGSSDIFVRDRVSGTTTRVSVATGGVQSNGWSYGPSISPDGRYVAFASDSTNLVPGDTNGKYDAFLHDRVTGSTERISVSSGEAQGDDGSYNPVVSKDGKYVAFDTLATNLVPSDTNFNYDVLLRDRTNGTTSRLSVNWAGVGVLGGSYGPSITPDGRFVAFHSDAGSLVPGDTNATYDVFVRDTKKSTTERVSLTDADLEATGNSARADISDDGRYVTFQSTSSDLTTGLGIGGGQAAFANIFVRDRVAGTTKLVSVATGGGGGNDWSERPAISGNGRFITYQSDATNLVASDSNGLRDVFLRGLWGDCPLFPDVCVNHMFFREVSWAAAEGVTGGYSDGTFRPADPVSRQAMVAFLYRAEGSPAGPFPDPGFTDVWPSDLFFKEISWAADSNVTGGYSDGSFRPGDPVSRQAMVAFLYRVAGSPPGPFPNPGFKDVPKSHPFFDEIAWAAANNVTGGYSDGTFKPGAVVSRQAMVAFLYRFYY